MQLLCSCTVGLVFLCSLSSAAIVPNGTQTHETLIDTNKTQCQSQMALNAALLQMLLNLQPKAYQLQPTLSNEILAVQPPVTSTILSTTSTIHTLTETLSRIVSIWFRNERIPTTLYSTTTALVTEYVTLTSTVVASQRQRRDVIAIESSMHFDSGHQFPITRKTKIQANSLASNDLLGFLAKPRIMEAWSNFLQVLEEEVP